MRTYDDSLAEEIEEAMAAEYESLSNQCRADPQRLEKLLAPDFHEFGSSGGEFFFEGISSIVASATDRDAEPIKVTNMRGWLIAEGIVMLKYTSQTSDRAANRTSLWRRLGPNQWHMFHHQGTPTAI